MLLSSIGFAAIAVLLVAQCGGSSKKAKPRVAATTSTITASSTKPLNSDIFTTTIAATSTTASTSETTVVTATSTTKATTSASGCTAGDNDLAKMLLSYAKSQQPSTPVTVSAIKHAPSDYGWASADVSPTSSSSTLQGFVAIAHCVGSQWVVADAGTSGVGCQSPVPAKVSAEIGLEC